VAAVVNVSSLKDGDGTGWAHRYPPLLAMAVALLIALVVLPSSLNLPQTNPSTVLEYAPVPPQDDDPPPPQTSSGLSSLGLAGSSGLQGGGAPGGEGGDGADQLPDELPGLPAGDLGKPNQRTPGTKRCVGNPPRQTEDPLSPPCVASFDGDNFGATYQGVTGDEITILFYEDGGVGSLITSKGAQEEAPAPGTVVDLDDNEKDDDYISVRNARVWLRYFNDRYQTYGRRVHGYFYFSGADSPEGRRADASALVSGELIPKPFAYVDNAQFRGSNQAFLDGMAKRGVLNFGTLQGLPNTFYRKYQPLVWGYYPDVERTADAYVSYLCTKVIPYPVSHSGNGDIGQPRKYGFISTSDPGSPGLQLLADYVRQGIKACGATIAEEANFPVAGYSVSAGQDPSYAAEAMARFRQANVTTILWAGGQETYFSKAAGTLRYYPEWVIDGDRIMESFFNAGQQDKAVWNYAWVVTNVTAVGEFNKEPGVQAFREASGPDYPQRDIQYAMDFYLPLFQLFRAIQVAGPRLGPTSIDKGFHAIPKIKSEDPTKPAGFYDSGDYTYVKDSQVMFWDSAADNPYANDPGCYRMVRGGARSLANDWSAGDTFGSGEATPADPCNAYDQSILIRSGPA
jgi:hypothetical protein